jgi:hypothetical protein
MSYRSRSQEDELKIGKGRKVADHFSLSRAWQRGYPSSRLQSPRYVVSCYSMSPQAVFKIISYGSRKKNLSNLVEYLIEREEGRVEMEGSDGLIMADEDIAEMLEEWNKDFKDKGSGKGRQRHFTHMLLSADVEPTEYNHQRVLETARQTAFTQFGQLGYEYKLVLHRDTDNPHVHIVLNNYNKVTHKKLRLDRHDLFRIRSDFADNLSKNGLRTHLSTLRQDRPEFLHRVTNELARLNKGVTDLESLLVNCAYLKRSNRLDAVLNKQSDRTKKNAPTNGFGFNADIKLDFDFSKGYLQLSVKGVKNRAINSVLQQIAYRELNSRSFGLARDGSATLTIKDIKALSPEVQKTVRNQFNSLIRQKIDKQMAGRSSDGLTKYKYLLKQTDSMLRKVGANKQLSLNQKSVALKELKGIRKKIIEGFDLKEIEKGAQLAKSEAAIKVYKELDDIDTKLGGKDYYNADQTKTIERKIDNLVKVGARPKNYKFANAKAVVYAEVVYPNKSKSKSKSKAKAKSSTFTVTVNRTQNKVFDSVLVKVARTIGSNKYKLKRNPKGVSSIVINDKELTPELKQQIEFVAKTILKREENIQDKFNDYKKQSILIKKKPTRTEFLHRKRALGRFAIRQSTQIKEAIKIFRKNKDLDTVKLLRGMLKESNYKKIIGGHRGIQRNIIKSRAGARVGRY